VSSTALALVLAAAALHASWNLAVKGVTTTDRVAFVWLYVVATCALWVPIGVVWVVVTGERPTWWWLGGPVVSALFHVVYQLVLQRGYAEGDLNLVYPLARGAGPLLTFVVAVTVLGQHPAPVEVVGVLAVVSGVLLISLGGRTTRLVHDRAGILWGLATGATIASYTLWDSHAVNSLQVPPVPYFVLSVALQLPFLGLLLVRRPAPVPVGEVWSSARSAALVVAFLSPLAYVFVLRAMQLAPVALVAAGRESSIVVGAVFGWLVLREERPARRLVGAVVVLAGIGLIAVG
jgi:drug/metabolite transporter (DMT)-like permease